MIPSINNINAWQLSQMVEIVNHGVMIYVNMDLLVFYNQDLHNQNVLIGIQFQEEFNSN